MNTVSYFKQILLFIICFYSFFKLMAQTPLEGFNLSDVTLTLADSPYELVGNYTTNFGTTLTIEAGVEIRCPSPEFNIQLFGPLQAIGTESSPIKIWGSNPSPDIYGGTIIFLTAGISQLEWVTIEKIGRMIDLNPATAIWANTGDLVINNCTFINTLESAITFSNSAGTITNSCFENIGTYGILNNAPDINITAENNYWGYASGPYHPELNPDGQGALVSNGVNFTPFHLGCRNDTPPSDLAVTDFTNPVSSCVFTQPQHVEILISNEGEVAESNFPIKYILNGSTTTATFTETIQAGETAPFSFPQTLNLNNVGIYDFQVFTDLENDQNPTNDLLSTTVEHLPQLDISISGNASICTGDYVSLSTEFYSGYEYEWSNGSNSTSIGATLFETTTFTLTVTDNSYPGCEDIASFTINTQEPPIIPVPFASSLYLCEGGVVTLTVNNVSDNLLWNTGETTPSITINQAGFYYVDHIENGCSSSSQFIYIANDPNHPSIIPSNDGIICGQESETLNATNGNAYIWSTGETTVSINVMPTESTIYSATVTTPNNCIVETNYTVQVSSDAPPGIASNLLPPNNIQNISLPVQFSWAAAEYATIYDLYVWLEGSNQPTFPQRSTTGLTLSYHSGLQFGTTYNWQVCARNVCSNADEECSSIQQFTLNQLPDLEVINASINAPNVAFSSTEIEIEWQVHNIGIGGTDGIFGTDTWLDVCYLSIDDEISSGDLYLGSRYNPISLVSGAGYTNSLTFNLPDGIQGEYNVIICTDRYNDRPESEEGNNCGISNVPIDIQLSDYADLIIQPLPPPTGSAGGIVAEGSSYVQQWTAENHDTGFNAGTTQSGAWYDKIFFAENDSLFNNQTTTLITSVQHEGNLDIGLTYNASASFTIPSYNQDTIYILVCTDATNQEYEYVFENNNCSVSEPLRILVTPRPDFSLTAVNAPDLASNGEYITINWEEINLGADYEGSLRHHVYISDRPDFSGNYASIGSDSENTLSINETPYSGTIDVHIPNNKTGLYYLLVVTNPYNSIDEINTNNNVQVDSITIISPNLIVTGIDAVSDLITGETVTFGWTISNIGEGNLLAQSVSDQLRLVDINDPDHAINLNTTNTVSIFSGGVLHRQLTYTIPAGLIGDYCLEVTTNYYHTAYENNQYNDNSFTICDNLHIEEASYPNLITTEITSSSLSLTAGDMIEINFSVNNGENVDAIGFWYDEIYLSTQNTWTLESAILLRRLLYSQTVLANDSYETSFSSSLSTQLEPGEYYLYLYTNKESNIYETNVEDNIIRSQNAISIDIYPLIDLQLDGLPNSPSELIPGQTASITYSVKNLGTVPTAVNTWKDGLYLSPDNNWEASDILIAEWQRDGVLGANQSYERQENFMLPIGFTDAFFLFLVIDYQNIVAEYNENNNEMLILQENGNPITVVFPPKPNLEILNFSVPTNADAGQPYMVEYNIINSDNDGHAIGNWTESIWLSTDPNLGGNDILIGQKNHTSNLEAGTSYTDQMQITLPLLISGNYFLILKTDAYNSLAEEAENDNIDFKYIFITQPLPGDLYISSNEISLPSIDTIATDITISWEVTNIGINALAGYMIERVYLSTDEIWDVNDIDLGAIDNNIGLDPNASAIHTLTTRLENIRSQEYYIFIKTDIQNHFLEDNESNNCSVSATTVFIDIPELPIGAPSTLTELELERSIYYHIDIPSDLVGETMKVTLTSNDTESFNELYLRRNDIPSRVAHDYSFDMPFMANQEIIIPALESGSYNLMAYAVTGGDIQDVELLAEIIPFQISLIDANQGGNTGRMTALIEGAKFHEGMRVWLESSTLGTIEADQVEIINSIRAFATFPLGAKSLGIYDVIIENNTLQTDTLLNGFEITPGIISNEPLLSSCSLSVGSQVLSVNNTLGSSGGLVFQALHQDFVRPNQVVPIELRYKNTSNIDMPIPTGRLSSINGFPLAPSTLEIGEGMDELPLVFYEENGPFGILRPGAEAIITVYSKATLSQGVLKFKLFPN